MAHAATCDTWTHAVLQIRCRSAHHRLRQRKMAPQIVTEGHKPQRIRIGTRKCVISRPCLSHGRLHISRQSTLRVLPGATHSRAVTGPARRYPHRRGAFALASWVVRRCRRAVRIKVQTAVGRASRWRSVRRAPIDCGPSGVGGRRMGNRNGARLVSPEWDEGVRFRSADVAHISLSSAVR